MIQSKEFILFICLMKSNRVITAIFYVFNGYPGQFLFACLMICSIGCKYSNNGSGDKQSGDFPYDLSNPEKRCILPRNLNEISGLAYYGDDTLICVNDEVGNVYFYDIRKSEVVHEIKFAKKGDFEGVTVADREIFIIRSDGNLYRIKNPEAEDLHVEEEPTPFTARNDIEGLSYHPDKNQLLIACKGSAEINNNEVKGRAVYSMDLSNKRISNHPFIHLTTDSFKQILKTHSLRLSRHMPYMPSGICVNHRSGHIYMISSVGRLLLEFNRDLEVISAIPLSSSLFIQPEGICVDDDENLYIASEGKMSDGYILKFIPAKKSEYQEQTNADQ